MIAPEYITGVILAGGKSSRMGQDKALLVYDGKPFIQHIAETLLQVFPRVIIISDKTEGRAFLGLPVYADIFHDSGPLGGIHSALAHATTPYVFVDSCDTPFINTSLISGLCGEALPDKITIPDDGKNIHPLIGIYPVSLLHILHKDLVAGKRRVADFLERNRHFVSALHLPQFEMIFNNVNTPADYAAINQSARSLMAGDADDVDSYIPRSFMTLNGVKRE
jgi:molybdopterin-guanine dinucleotide biosynthesis protein A